MQVVSFTELRKNLKQIMDMSADQHEPVVITRPHQSHMVLLSLDSYESLKETDYLLGNPANAAHLQKSLKSLKARKIVKKDLIE